MEPLLPLLLLVSLIVVGLWGLWLRLQGGRYWPGGDARYAWHYRAFWRIMSGVLIVGLLSGLSSGGPKALLELPLRSKALLLFLGLFSLSEGWIRWVGKR